MAKYNKQDLTYVIRSLEYVDRYTDLEDLKQNIRIFYADLKKYKNWKGWKIN